VTDTLTADSDAPGSFYEIRRGRSKDGAMKQSTNLAQGAPCPLTFACRWAPVIDHPVGPRRLDNPLNG